MEEEICMLSRVLSNISNPPEASVRVSGEVPATWFPVVPCCSARVALLSGVDRTVSRTVGVSADGSTGSSRRWSGEGSWCYFRPRGFSGRVWELAPEMEREST